MEKTIKEIILHNNADDATQKIMLIVKKNTPTTFTLDDVRKAFLGGRDSVEAALTCEPYGDMEEYAVKKITKSFKQYLHENKISKKIIY